ncbi:Nucleotide-diphospho-sugar transferases superfamily protein isoform 4 [Theobroma cacao]|uniref:Nucleotide-diphospho-sugar transferases superfamily protein isoform 4 n=1 Tax=Theobroma cacao TaxID=3641 RepID=A0A061FLS8_THECC|nr:Nucleotide-diphospho-sugar transferases superfamily protein isoform 4 [Theobroma cacao]
MRGSLPVNRRTVFKLRQVGISTLGSVKIRILLCGCVALTLLAVANRNRDSSSFMRWTDDVDSLHSSSSSRGRYAIVMNTWKRYDLLKKSISHYASCPRLESIHLVWSEPDPPSDSLKRFLNHAIQLNSGNGHRVQLVFDINKEDSLNNRFKEIRDLKTDAVFSIDDDVIFPCSSVEFAFTVWQSAPDTMVGYVPRMHWVDEKKGKDNYIYGGWWSVWWTGTYSMILSKAAFFHKKYLKLYTDEMPASIKEYITRNRSLFIYYHCRLFKCFHHFMHVTCFINILTPVLDSPGIVKILQCHFLLQMQQVLLPYG